MVVLLPKRSLPDNLCTGTIEKNQKMLILTANFSRTKVHWQNCARTMDLGRPELSRLALQYKFYWLLKIDCNAKLKGGQYS